MVPIAIGLNYLVELFYDIQIRSQFRVGYIQTHSAGSVQEYGICMLFMTFHTFFIPIYSFSMQRTKTPELVSEDAEPVWLKGVQNIASTSMIMPRIHGIRTGLFDLMGDPRIGPVLLLSALMSFGTIWLQRSQPSRRPTQQSQSQPKSDVSES